MKIKQECLQGDKYGNSQFSHAIEEGKIKQVREYVINTDRELSDIEFLKYIAIEISKNHKEIDQNIALRIYSEAKDYLNLIGEDISDVIEAYNFD